MASLTSVFKRALVGRPQSSAKLSETLLPKRIALPVFASDALSSNAYATQEILLVLSLGGLAYIHFAPWVAAAVVVVFFVVVASYRQNVHAYPSGGGDYENVSANLGPNSGVVVASALLVDYVMTVAVWIAAAVVMIASAFVAVDEHRVVMAVVLIGIVTFLNLRGVRESGTAFAIPTYFFMASIFLMVGWAVVRLVSGADLQAESADWKVVAEGSFTGLALVYLVARAFTSGTTALTGVEAISNGVPAFRKPKSKNAATTLLLLGVISMTMFASITWLALKTNVRVAESNADLVGMPDGATQKTVIAQVANAVFSNAPVLALIVSSATALILVLAANTAFNGFPVLGSILARDGYLPRQLHTRGDRLAFSNGILALAAAAIALVIVFDANVSKLIHLYIVGVFVSFTMSQTGMVKHWNRFLAVEPDPVIRRRMLRSRAVNFVGLLLTGTVLIVVLLTKFTRGAYLAIIAMVVLFVLMKAIAKHYTNVADELKADASSELLPARIHAVVLVSKLHKPALRALAYARASRPATLEAVTVSVDPVESEALLAEWDERNIAVPLRVLDSPYREITRPVVDYVKAKRQDSPRDIVEVYVPEYVVGRWWEALLHNQSALRLKTRLRFTPGVVVVSVPYQLRSSLLAADRPETFGAGSARRGEPTAEEAERAVAKEMD
ncbi:MAG: APC family permease [Actinomycetia bacterium]|nr:APC family permease [Actinomycetes bacterium]